MPRHLIILLVVIGSALSACGSEAEDKVEPVTFSEVSVDEISQSEAVVRFKTSAPTECVLSYGTSIDALELETTGEMEERYMVDHEVWLTDLQPGTSYYFQATATDRNYNSFLSETYDFDTLVESSGGPAPGGGNLLNVARSANGAAISDVSSNFGGGGIESGFGANNAIDGELGTEWSSSGDGDDAFIEVTLSQERTIERVGFRSRKMADGTSIVESFKIVVDDGLERGPFSTPDPDQTFYFELDEPIAGTTFRFEAVTTTGGNTGAREVMLFSQPDE